jgi:16S rRNA (uracil1498-N3)-methyltransferase
MHRFFIPEDWIYQDEILVKGGQARQIFQVLRLKPKDHILVLDNSGWEYEVEIDKVSGELVQGKAIGRNLCRGEPGIKIALYQSLLKGDKFEFVLQKAVELGVTVFVPLVCHRCVVREPGAAKTRRWERIIREAAEQSRRGLVPALRPILSLESACQSTTNPSILLWEGEESTSIAAVLKNPAFQNSPSFSIFIGPEGGFLPSEVEYAQSQGIIPVSLGPRILRAETAGLVAISVILYERGEFELRTYSGNSP